MPKTESADKVEYYNLSEPRMGMAGKNRREKRA